MTELESRYSHEQQALINGDYQAVLVAAPAGSGKTRLLIGRAASLVRSGVPADRICCLTFTQKSAQEIQKRLCETLGPAGSEIVSATFHGFALQCLKVDSGALNLGSDFRIISMHESIQILKSVARTVDPEWHVSDQQAQKMYQNLSRSINKNEPVPLDCDAVDSPTNSIRMNALYNQFVEEKLRLKLVDFDDLMFMFSLLLDSDDAYRQRWSERFIHILVDEYQDVNDLQARLIDQLSSYHGKVFAIGDHAQAIYGFRGANVEHFRRFCTRFKNAEVHQLTTNFRSTSNIVNAAELLLKEESIYTDRAVVPAREDGCPIYLVGSPNKEIEATFIAAEISRLIDEGLCPSEISVLVRLKAQAGALEIAIRERQLPVRLKLGRRLCDRSHVKIALSLIRLAFEPSDEGAIRDVALQTKGFGPTLADGVIASLSRDDTHGLTPHQLSKIEWFKTKIFDVLATQPASAQLLWQLWCLLKGLDPMERIDEIAADLEHVGALWTQYGSYGAFHNALVLGTSSDHDDAVLEPSVTLMSIHQSKGLEWDTVFVPGLNEGTLPIFGSNDTQDTLSEERRLLYVACTRARERLYLSCQAATDVEFSQFNGYQSRFLRHAFYRGPHLFNGIWIGE